MEHFTRSNGVAVLSASAIVAATCLAAAPRAKRPEYPLYCAGIVVGMSTDTDVRRMYGDGLFVKDEGHGGGRYFVDPKRQVTLHVETGVDRVIETVSYGRGVRLPQGYAKGTPVPKQAISANLTAGEHVWLGIRLGENASYVVRQFGKPKKDTRTGSTRVIRYETGEQEMAYTLFYEAEFRFEKDRLVSVKLYNGE
jgi:hypothetical protein